MRRRLRGRLVSLWILVFIAACAGVADVRAAPKNLDDAIKAYQAILADSTQKEALLQMVASISYGVPASPAFELLPNKPDEVVHALTPHDFQSSITTWFDGRRTRVGLALDTRPLAQSVGTLEDYQRDWWRQAMFRTVFSVGAAAATEGSSDVIGAVGVRIPLVDRGDPRTNRALQDAMAENIDKYLTAAGGAHGPAFGETLEQLRAKLKRAGTEAIRDRFAASRWNATRVDLGFAGSVRSVNGTSSPDSVESNRAGLWASAATGVGPALQLTAMAKSAWIRADSLSQETSREVAGLRARLFAHEVFALSAEIAWIRSRHGHASSLDEAWRHYAAVAEWYVPQLKGWIGVGYGGDSSHRDRSEDSFHLMYALYRDRVLKK